MAGNQIGRESPVSISGSDSDDNKEEGKGTWTKQEHQRFLDATKMYPSGPWKAIANAVGTRTVRQTQTHAQKYREKIARRNRNLLAKSNIPGRAARNIYMQGILQSSDPRYHGFGVETIHRSPAATYMPPLHFNDDGGLDFGASLDCKQFGGEALSALILATSLPLEGPSLTSCHVTPDFGESLDFLIEALENPNTSSYS